MKRILKYKLHMIGGIYLLTVIIIVSFQFREVVGSEKYPDKDLKINLIKRKSIL